jgi:hypothetical protein
MLLIASSSIEKAGVSRPAEAVVVFEPSSLFDTIKTNLNDYSWPTDASRKVTSSFAEYRSAHFHGGIDISTNGHAGYKVLAARDGFVYRISIAPNGYGKMLFIRHNDGYVTTYAHLQTFNEAINAVAREEQYRRGTYSINLIINTPQLPVKQGDVIAYTGDTGFGPPHLHFELRDENLNPVNPMLCDSFAVLDDIPPSIRRLMISPLTYNSSVNNENQPKFFSRFPRSKRSFRIAPTVRIHGKIGFGVEAIDRSDGSWSKAGIHRMELYIDDSLTFAMQLNRVPAEETKMIDLHYDFPTILRGRGKFQKLYRDIGNTLPFYEKRPEGSGIINSDSLTEGEHHFRIICKDIHSNQTELTGTLLINRTPSLELMNVDEEEIVLSGTDLGSVIKFYVYGKKINEQTWVQHTLPKGRYELDGTGVELPVDTKRYDVLKIVAETKLGTRSAPLFYFMKKPQTTNHEIKVNSEIYNDYVRISATTNGSFTSAPICSLKEGNSIKVLKLEAIELNKYSGIVIPSDSFAGQRIIEVTGEVDGQMTSAIDSVELYSLPIYKKGSFSYNDGNLRISYDSGAVFKPLHMLIRTESYHSSQIYELGPEDVLLNKGITVSLPSPSSFDKQHYGLFFRSNGSWTFQTSEPDSGRKYFSTTVTRTLGDIAVLHDDDPPVIGRLRVFPQNGKPHIGFGYYDDLSGVDPDEIKMYIDSVPVIPEIDGEHHRVWYQAEQRLDRGKHTLKVTMKDRMKNETEATRVFSIK